MAAVNATEFEPGSFDALPGWAQDDHAAAFQTFRRTALHAVSHAYRSGSIGPDFSALGPAHAAAAAIENPDAGAARSFFEQYFIPARIVAPGFVTGYYEPMADASPIATDSFRFPVHARPDDLVALDEHKRPPGLDPSFRFGRRQPDGRIVEYHDRRSIESGAIAGQRLEIAWLSDRVDLFFIHIQGAARLKMPDGAIRRITYAAKSGHAFTGIGRVLAELGEITPAEVTMQSIRAWLAAHPARMDEILWQNRSYIFFREAPVEHPALGPIAAAKVPLTPGRSLAVDRLLHTFSTPFYIDAPQLHAPDGQPFRRLMIAQDTGSAIIGPARGDLFMGSGDAAGEIAGTIRHDADFHCLLPRDRESAQ